MRLSGAELRPKAPEGWKDAPRIQRQYQQAPAFGVRQSSAAFSTIIKYPSPHLTVIPANGFAH